VRTAVTVKKFTTHALCGTDHALRSAHVANTLWCVHTLKL
jgi:hypothetical protein